MLGLFCKTLHKLCIREAHPLLIHFVLLSLGQANYGWANSVCERVVEERVRAGLPGVAIQWGGVGDVGVLADTLGEIEVCLVLQSLCSVQ